MRERVWFWIGFGALVDGRMVLDWFLFLLLFLFMYWTLGVVRHQ